FQSTRLREARPGFAYILWVDISFNPRACVRRDGRFGGRLHSEGAFQSTRLREARPEAVDALIDADRFQSTRLREARQPPMPGRSQHSGFQSTRLREARPVFRPARRGRSFRFNPRACVRRDSLFDRAVELAYKFQSTRLREARRPLSSGLFGGDMFQSTRLR